MSTLYVDNLQPNLGSGVSIPGHVVQVVQETQRQAVSSAASSTDIVVLTAKITPRNANNKILVSFHTTLTATDNRGTVYGDSAYTRVMRDSTTEVCRSTVNVINNGDVRSRGNISSAKLDSPATTSEVTYTLQARGGEEEYDAFDITSDSETTLILMEIAQ